MMSDAGSLTPNDLRNQVFGRKMRGYDPVEVAAILEEAATQWENLLAEHMHVSEKCSALEVQIKRYAELEQTLRDTLVLARKAAEDETETAKKQAEIILERARLHADNIIKQAQARTERYRQQVEQLRAARNRLKADLEGLLHSYTKQIAALDTSDNDGPTASVDLEQPSNGISPGTKALPPTEFSDVELTDSLADEATGTGVEDSFLSDDVQDHSDTSDAFDAALNKIFGGETGKGATGRPATEGE